MFNLFAVTAVYLVVIFLSSLEPVERADTENFCTERSHGIHKNNQIKRKE
jgi:hypothetical protein